MVADEGVIDPREIDKVLSEVAGMMGRWNLFRKFLSEALKVIQFCFFFALVNCSLAYRRNLQKNRKT